MERGTRLEIKGPSNSQASEWELPKTVPEDQTGKTDSESERPATEDSSSVWPAGWKWTAKTDEYLVFSYSRDTHPPGFTAWVQEYRKKMDRVCKIKCSCELCKKAYFPESCHLEHEANVGCPPCITSVAQRRRNLKTKPTGGPIEIALSARNGVYTLDCFTFPLCGKTCNVIISVKNRPAGFQNTFVWWYVAARVTRWELEHKGFENKTLVRIFERMEEEGLDWMMDLEEEAVRGLQYHNIEEMAPSYNTMILVSCGGQLKVAGQHTDSAIDIVGDNKLGTGNKLGCQMSYNLMCYGNPGSKLIIQQGHLCKSDVIMMVPDYIPREKRIAIAKSQDDVVTMARNLMVPTDGKAMNTCKGLETWVAKIREP